MTMPVMQIRQVSMCMVKYKMGVDVRVQSINRSTHVLMSVMPIVMSVQMVVCLLNMVVGMLMLLSKQ